jgi:N6-L-threonylcarbamoyladenine synthase
MADSRPAPLGSGLVIAFDTASDNIALAVGRQNDDGTLTLIASFEQPAKRQANTRLLPALDALFLDEGLSRRDVACVVCGLGPGSFTGVRIGVATAKGIARGLGVPLFGVSTLDAVAWGAWLAGVRENVGVIADAMRGEVYPARFKLDAKGVERLDSHTVAKATEVAERWSETADNLLLIGDGLHKYADAFGDSGTSSGTVGTGAKCPTLAEEFIEQTRITKVGHFAPVPTVPHAPVPTVPHDVIPNPSSLCDSRSERVSRASVRNLSCTAIGGFRLVC